MEKLITILFFLAIGAIFNWLQKKAQDKKERENPRPPVAPRPTVTPRPLTSRPAPSRPSSWEDELRRLLGDETAAPPPARPAPTPPPQPVSRPTPVIISAPRPVPAPAPRPIKVAPPAPVIPRQAPVPQPQPAALVTLTGAAKVEQTVKDLGAMQESARAYERARQLDTLAASRIEAAATQPVQATSVIHRTAVSPEVTQVVAMFRNARSARQAVLASIILGPPKSLEAA